MADSPSETVFAAQSLTWRKVTGLNNSLGARAFKVPQIIAGAGVAVPLFSSLFGPRTIDRIIGVNLRFGGVPGAASLTLADLQSGFIWQTQASGHLGNYWFNIETLETGANLTLVCSVALTAAMNAQASFYNFEIPTETQGHYG
jgi:hypothetical protein